MTLAICSGVSRSRTGATRSAAARRLSRTCVMKESYPQTTSSRESPCAMRVAACSVSCAYCGSGSRGCETKRWTPLRSQICTTSASLPTASPPGVPLSGTPISEAAICRS